MATLCSSQVREGSVGTRNHQWCSGGWDGSHYRREVLAWQGEDEEWVEVGMIESGRKFHAVTSIMTDNQAMQYCA